MSSASRWSFTETATVWQLIERDKFGVASFADPYTIKCSWLRGGRSVRDNDGVEFVPRDRYITENNTIKRGYYMCRGDKTNQLNPLDVSESAIVRRVDEIDQTALGVGEVPDFRVYTD